MKPFSLLLLSILMNFLLLNPETRAQTYRYVDKDGVSHFTNVPSDPRYKPAGANHGKASKKTKRSNPKKYPQSAHPRPVKR